MNELKKVVGRETFVKGGIQSWYESFLNNQDTLNESDYSIFINDPVTEISGNYFGYNEPPLLRNLLDNPRYVFEAAKGYLLFQKIPFLQELLNVQELNSNIPQETHESTDTEFEEVLNVNKKKSKKRGSQLTTKQQIILLTKLGILGWSGFGGQSLASSEGSV